MAYHHILFPLLVAAINGQKVTPVDPGGGSVNYKLMHAFTAWIVDPSSITEARCLSLLDEMQDVGHLSLRGPKGYQTEAGSPGAHWVFNVGSVTGGLLWAIKRKNRPMSMACARFIEAELALGNAFQFNGRVMLPCSRVADEKGEAPLDDYRDVYCQLACGLPVKKSKKYWGQPLALAVRSMRELYTRPEYPELAAEAMGFPKLYLPIKTRALGGGYEAWIEDTPAARAALIDPCHRVQNSELGMFYGVDWRGDLIKVSDERQAKALEDS